jgi:predicted naringenin-chalcone synthase
MICGWAESYKHPRVLQLFLNSDIDTRHLYLDRDALPHVETSGAMNERFRRGAVEVGGSAVTRCLADGGLSTSDIDCLIVATCTGYLCPGLSPILIKELGFRNDVQRADLVGMGCAGAMPALQRASDFVRAYPSKKALVLTVEICSACYYVDDSLETMVGNAICADGAAAMVIGSATGGPGPRVLGFTTLLEPSLLESVGLEHKEGKLRIILSKDIRGLAGGISVRVIDNLLRDHGLRREDISRWIVHSGGRRVIDTIQRDLGLVDDQLMHSREVLRRYGNMSSPTVLFVLQEFLRNRNGDAPRPGDRGVMLALGPGLAAEAALLEW